MHSFAIAILLAYTELTSSQFVGKWEGKFNDLPAIEITLVPDQDRISGTIGLFFSSAERMAVGRQRTFAPLPFFRRTCKAPL